LSITQYCVIIKTKPCKAAVPCAPKEIQNKYINSQLFGCDSLKLTLDINWPILYFAFMKKNKLITANEMRVMCLDDFKEHIKSSQVIITVQKKRLCRAVLNREETEDMVVMNYSDFTRKTKHNLKVFFEDESAIIKLVTNAHHQDICYLVK
jgi:hypothetical protein